MRSKLLLGALCVAVSVSAAGVALADVFTGRIAPGKTKVYSLTTDTSTILQIKAIAFHERTDLDIMVTLSDGAVEEVVLDSRSGLTQLEEGTVGVPGATDVTISVTSADGPLSRFVLLVTSPSDPGVGRGGITTPVAFVGEFGPDDSPADPQLATLQRLIRERGRPQH